MQITVPCEVFARLASIVKHMPDDIDPWFRSVRYDSGVLVCTNKHVMAAEFIGGPSGVLHIAADVALIAQCRTEGALGSTLTIQYVEALNFASAKTTLGYNFPGNAIVNPGGKNDFDKWRSLFEEPQPTVSKGVMLWETQSIGLLLETAPSGSLTFPEFIDAKKPMILRDPVDTAWAGMFIPSDMSLPTFHAKRPDWI